MELQVGVKVLLKNNEGKYLLIKRTPEKYPGVGVKWDISGGRIKPGTALLENLKREIKEETSLDLLDEPKLLAAQDILRIPGYHVVRLTYTASIAGEPKLSEEHTDFQWVGKGKMKNIENLDIYLRELLDRI